MRIEHWYYTMPLRLRSLFRRHRLDQELRDEMQGHLEMQIEEKPGTRHEFRGGALCRTSLPWRRPADRGRMPRLPRLSLARRTLAGSQVRSADAPQISQLHGSCGNHSGLGYRCNTALFSIVYAVLLKPLPYDNPDRLVRIYTPARKAIVFQ